MSPAVEDRPRCATCNAELVVQWKHGCPSRDDPANCPIAKISLLPSAAPIPPEEVR